MANDITPELPADPGPDIQRILDRTKTPEDPTAAIKAEADQYLDLLPAPLRLSVLTFIRDTTHGIFAQQTEGDGSVKVTDGQKAFYDSRFGEIRDSGVLNPHLTPARKIT